ncbi:MAG: hypothetical protein LBJ18_03575 [Rickettsiales bacterium]|nr:hypothetical protein [Rickettsiales bacterium]
MQKITSFSFDNYINAYIVNTQTSRYEILPTQITKGNLRIGRYIHKFIEGKTIKFNIYTIAEHKKIMGQQK